MMSMAKLAVIMHQENAEYLRDKDRHRQQYCPKAKWYRWQTKKTGINNLWIQNDIAYKKHVGHEQGLHELHIAEEIHRFSVNPVLYTDGKRTVRLNPAVPPMGDPYTFHNSIWAGSMFDNMWTYWVQCYPAHASDITKEIAESSKKNRQAWWDLKNKPRTETAETPYRRRKVRDSSSGQQYCIHRQRGHFEMTYMDTPCRICGSNDHPAFRQTSDNYGVISYTYMCPVAAEADWETTSMRPCPEKMAMVANYDEEAASKAWVYMVLEGWGQRQTSKTLGTYLAMVKYFCREHVCNQDRQAVTKRSG